MEDSYENKLKEKINVYLSDKFEFSGEFYAETPYFIGIGTWTPQAASSIEEGSEPVEKTLSYIESAALVSLLEDAVDELEILKYVIGAPSLVWDSQYKTPKERFTRRLTPERIFPEVDSKPVLTPAIKLQRDREFVDEVFLKLTKSLMEEGSFIALTLALEGLRQEEEDEINLVQELKKNLILLKDLRAKVREKRKLDDLEEREREELLYHLKDEIADVQLKCGVEERFVNKWENVRNAQNQWKLRNSENYYKDNLAKLTTMTKTEKRVTYELQTFLKANQTELEDQLEDWMALYDAEMERRETKIIHLKYNRDQEEEKKEQLHQLYENRKVEIKEWIEFREVRKARIKASLQIQSWWRGFMVRKKLGPYKPKKAKKENIQKKK